ncbi:MAG: hypothetical protein RR902_05880, partial [Oscillospiraceae bacterium]
LTNPYTILFYFLYFAIEIVKCCIALFKKKKIDWDSIKNFIFFSFGGALIGGLILLFIFSKTTFAEFFANFPFLLNDPMHHSKTLFGAAFTYIKNLNACFTVWWVVSSCTVILTFIDKNISRKSAYFILNIIGSIFSLLYLARSGMYESHVNLVMLPLTWLGLNAYAMLPNDKRPKNLLFCEIIAFLYSICMVFASDQGILVIASSFSISTMVGVIFICLFLKELYNSKENANEPLIDISLKKATIFLCIIALTLQFSIQIYKRFSYVFFDDAPSKLTQVIPDGPQKGLLTTPENYQKHMSNMNDIAEINYKKGEKILFANNMPLGYLMLNPDYASYSAWFVARIDGPRLAEFYKLHPTKTPDIIFSNLDSLRGMTLDEYKDYIYANWGLTAEVLESGNMIFRKPI